MQSLAALLPVGPKDELVHRGARRRATRYPVHAGVKVLGHAAGRGVVLNASVGGLRVTLDRRCEAGDRLELELSFASDKTGRERAEVVWCRELPDGTIVGLRFV